MEINPNHITTKLYTIELKSRIDNNNKKNSYNHIK